MSSIAERIAGLSQEKRQLLELLRRENLGEISSASKLPLEVDAPVATQQSQAFCLISDVDRQNLPDDVEDAYPLTVLQAGMIYHMEETPDYPLYHNVDSYNLAGELSPATMQDTVNRVVARHAVLRTSFALRNYSEPLQLVHKTATLPVTIDDLRHLPAPEQDKIVNAYVEKEKRLRFDLAYPPLLRFHIHRRTADTFQFTLTEFHPILDGWSLNSTLAEIFTLYFHLLNKQPVPDDLPLSTSFRDYVVLERQALETDEFKQYWTQALSDASMLQLPRWPASHRNEGERPIVGLRVPIDQQLLEDLKQFAQSLAVPIKSVLLAAHIKVLSALGGQSDVVTGLSTQGRPETAGGDDVRGLFLNIVPYRLNLADGSWVDLVRKAFAVERDLLPYRRYPMAAIQKNLGGRPLFETAFSMVRFHVYLDLLESDNKLEMVGTGQELEESNFTLMTNFGMHPSGSHLILVLEYHTSELCDEQVQAIARYYTNTLAAMVCAPHNLHQSYNVLSPAEQEQIIVKWNSTKTDFASPECLHQLFEEQTARTPDAIALVFGAESLTYQRLNERANQLAHHLLSLAAGPESVVAILMERSFEMVVSLLAVLKAGAAYLPLDPTYPVQRLSFMLEDAQPLVLLRQSAHDGLLTMPENMTVIVVDEQAQTLAGYASENPPSASSPDNLAYVIYTSGSTGQPKGVMVSHRAIANRLLWMTNHFSFDATQRILNKTSFSFDASLWELFVPLMTGARLVLARPGGQQESDYLVEVMASEEITTAQFVPSMLGALVSEEGLARCTELTSVFCGGEVLSRELVDRFFAAQAAVELHNLYGPTEAAIDATHWRCLRPVDGENEPQSESESGGVPIGRPIANMQMYVLDERMMAVPIGVTGELYIGGVGLARGYRGRADLTAERFVPHPHSNEAGARLYRTGDVGRYLATGELEYVGRSDYQVKVRGYRIELGEIEAALRGHGAVAEAIVVTQADESGHRRLIGYLISRNGKEVTGSELRSYLGERLPEYMVPGMYVWLEQWPVTSNGKVDRRALAQMEGSEMKREQGYAAPRTEVEEVLARIWSEALRVEKVGIHDNFFELGGDSILILPIIVKASRAGLKLIARNIFQHPTIAELATVAIRINPARIKQQTGHKHKLVTGLLPLTPIQHTFFETQLAHPHHFNQSVMLSAPESLTPNLLHTILRQIMLHHDSLRLRFQTLPDGSRQARIDDLTQPLPLSVIDLSHLPGAAQVAAIESAASCLQASLDLAAGPILRLALFLGGDAAAGNRLLIIIHHLAIDGVSWRILLEDLQASLAQLSAGQALQLPPKTTSFKQWAELLQTQVASGSLASEASYWVAQATSHVSAFLPPWPVTPAPIQAAAVILTLSLSAAETSALLQQAPAAYHTQINDLLLTALALAVRSLSGETRLRLELEGHGREEEVVEGVELGRTLGWFTTLFPVLLDISGAGTEMGAAVRSIKGQLRAIPQHGIGYGLLKYLAADSSVSAKLRAAARADLSFNYLGQFDQVLSVAGGFAGAPESAGASQSAQTPLPYALEINGSVSGGRLRLDWSFSPQVVGQAQVEQLMAAYAEALRSLIRHCAGRRQRGYTPSDFLLSRLSQEELDALVNSGQGQVEDIYALSPLQEGLLFHTVQAPGSGVYMQQMSCRFGAGFDAQAFKQSWREVVHRHGILRTGFAWQGLGEPVQVVRAGVEMEVKQQDWSRLTQQQRAEAMASYLAQDRARGFDLQHGPLMRIALMQEHDALFSFVWSTHHLILDGWSMGLLVQEVFENYEAAQRGKQVTREAARPYRDYIQWLRHQDMSRAEAYWRKRLEGLKTPTPLGISPSSNGYPGSTENFAHLLTTLSATGTEGLKAFARQQKLTLNTVIQGAWALLLSRDSGASDVVFGVVVSGRPTELAGFENMIGVFINTLPMRTEIRAEEKIGAWLGELQKDQVEMRQFEHSPLVKVQGWSEVPRGLPLFESYLNFLNYPLDDSLRNLDGALEIHDARSVERANYPIAIDVMPGKNLSVEITYDLRRFDATGVARTLKNLELLLDSFIAHPDATLGMLQEILNDSDRQQQTAQEQDLQQSLRQKIKAVRRRAV